MSDQPVAETSTWQHTHRSQRTTIHARGGIRTRNLSNRSAACLRTFAFTSVYLSTEPWKHTENEVTTAPVTSVTFTPLQCCAGRLEPGTHETGSPIPRTSSLSPTELSRLHLYIYIQWEYCIVFMYVYLHCIHVCPLTPGTHTHAHTHIPAMLGSERNVSLKDFLLL